MEKLGQGRDGIVTISGDYAVKTYIDSSPDIKEFGALALINRAGYGLKVHEYGRDRIVLEKASMDFISWMCHTPIETREKMLPKIVEMLLRDLAIIHSCGLIHGDVKPGNILLWVDGDDVTRVKICDFGLSGHSPQTDVIYTYAYRPSEVWFHAAPCQASDIWALGVALLEACELFPESLFLDLKEVRDFGQFTVMKRIDDRRSYIESCLGKECADRIYSMLKWDPTERLCSASVNFSFSAHEWKTNVNREAILQIYETCRGLWKAVPHLVGVHAVDIFMRYLTVSPQRKHTIAEFALYTSASIVLAIKWGTEWTFEDSDYEYYFQRSKSDVDDAQYKILQTLNYLVWVPGMEDVRPGDECEGDLLSHMA